MLVIKIGPRMDLNLLAEAACCDQVVASFMLLELLAEGHTGKSFDDLSESEFARALDSACSRMDQLDISCE